MKKDLKQIQRLRKLRKEIVTSSNSFSRLAHQIYKEWGTFSKVYKDSSGVMKVKAVSSESKKLESSLKKFSRELEKYIEVE